jgi:hypothetical protein
MTDMFMKTLIYRSLNFQWRIIIDLRFCLIQQMENKPKICSFLSKKNIKSLSCKVY